MIAQTAAMSLDLPCHRCGYDLRAQPEEGLCPECGASVAEARRVAAIPRRPAWRDSDPRWRRRVVAGAWLLVLLPLMEVLGATGCGALVPVPNVYGFGAVRTLDDTLLSFRGVYEPLIFCMGVVLLFSKERGRRAGKLDWTRRWGVLCTYVVFLLLAAQVLFLVALVMAGIAAIFQSMPPEYQPGVTQLFVEVSAGYLRYGAHPTTTAAFVVLVAFSCIVILLACIALFDALRSSGSKRSAAMLLAPLALFALVHLAEVWRYCLGFSSGTSEDVFRYALYFWPQVLVNKFDDRWTAVYAAGSPMAFSVEVAKWCVVLAIAVWLSIAQVTAWRRRRKTDGA